MAVIILVKTNSGGAGNCCSVATAIASIAVSTICIYTLPPL